MSEFVETRRKLFPLHRVHKQSLLESFKQIKFKNLITTTSVAFYHGLVHTMIVIMEYLISILRGTLGQQELKYNSKETQTYSCYQDITELITYHFGLLHEEHYINKIIHKSQWNCMNREINLIKEQVKKLNQETVIDRLALLKEDVDSLKNIVNIVSNKIDRSCSFSSINLNNHIPAPPPLPPPGFMLPNISIGLGYKTSKNEKLLFGGDCPPRPLITVESLKQVKLKKTPVPLKNETKDVGILLNGPSTETNQSVPCIQRPKTTDNAKTHLNSSRNPPSPRPGTSS